MTILTKLKKQLANRLSKEENAKKQLKLAKEKKLELARKIEKEKLGYQNVNTKALKTVCNLMSKKYKHTEPNKKRQA